MSGLPASYLKFDYSLRPSKQVERKLVVEMLHRLGQDVPGFELGDYTYIGFGSPFYTDFLLFHKYLFIDRMVCVEGSNIPKRMRFNKPYDFIDLRMGLFSDILPDLDRSRRYFLWLDYDTPLTGDNLRDVLGATSLLAPGSVILVTLDAEVRIPEDLDSPDLSDDRKIGDTVERLSEELGRYTANPIKRSSYTRDRIPELYAEIVRNAIAEACGERDLTFTQLLNVRYADDAQMMSLGGVLADQPLAEEIQASRVHDLDFVHTGAVPKMISVPPLTVRERLWLEQNLDAPELEFELAPRMVKNFRQLYRHYPVYQETLL